MKSLSLSAICMILKDLLLKHCLLLEFNIDSLVVTSDEYKNDQLTSSIVTAKYKVNRFQSRSELSQKTAFYLIPKEPGPEVRIMISAEFRIKL